jgi:MFS family permease
MRKFLSSYRYEIIAGLSGAVVMMLELVGARMVAPYFGTSIYVWTAMIGVILGSLSLGYWYGGRIADRGANDQGLAVILSVAAVLVGVSVMTQDGLLQMIAGTPLDIRLQAVIAALILFAPASCLLGIVSPYVVKLKLSSLKTAGSSVGQLYAAGTAGSIIGTFATGYWLIAWFGNYTLGLMLVVLLLAVSFIAQRYLWRWRRVGVAVVALIALIAPPTLAKGVIADVDSAYSRYQVRELVASDDSRLRLLMTDSVGAQSGYYVGQPDQLAFEYIAGFKTVAQNYGPMKDMLMIGGGAYTFPGYIARKQPQTQVDIVEIDPKLDQIATDHFGFKPAANLRLIHQDGRVYLNQNKRVYDIVYVDAFSSLSPPFQLATIEAVQGMKRALTDNGIVAVNVIASPDSSDGYYAATYRTYKQVFDTVKVYRVQGEQAIGRQNLLFVMGNSNAMSRITDGMQGIVEAPAPAGGMLLSDDHAPVDQLIEASKS